MPLPKTQPCPVCGRPVPLKAKSCHHCGACDKTGWNEEQTSADGLDLPDDNFDYEKFKEEEFGEPRKKKRFQLTWKITAAVLVVVFLFLALANYLFS